LLDRLPLAQLGTHDLARVPERLLGICERGLGMAKHPQRERPIRQDCHPNLVAS